jgi:hypothetical protein
MSQAQLVIAGINATGRQAVTQLVTFGQAAARIDVTWKVSPAPSVTSIVTPAGTFSNVVGVHIQTVAVRGVNFARAAQGQASILVKAFTSLDVLAAGDEEIYYARGAGQVETILGPQTIFPGEVFELTRCTG